MLSTGIVFWSAALFDSNTHGAMWCPAAAAAVVAAAVAAAAAAVAAAAVVAAGICNPNQIFG